MPIINLKDEAEMAKAIASGLIWSAPRGAQFAAINGLISGKYPIPATLPEHVQNIIENETGKPVQFPPVTRGPA